MSSNIMIGSEYEGGHVFAWGVYPSSYAIKNSGAREVNNSVVISFSTGSPFVKDTGIDDPRIMACDPRVSLIPGPIVVYDVRIEGR